VPGTRNHATLTAEAWFDGEAAALDRKAIELDLGGDPTALRLCLDRVIAPRRGRPVEVALPPVESVADIAGAMTAITWQRRGDLTPSEAGELAQVVATLLRAIESSEFDRRLQLLEAAYARSAQHADGPADAKMTRAESAEARERGTLRARIAGGSARRLDPRHVVVAEAKMMADLVDQHMAHQMGEVLTGFAPIIEDRPAVEKDHVDMGPRVADALVRQGDAAIEAENVERAVEAHRPLGLLVGKLLDRDHDRAEMTLEPARDRAEGAARQLLDIGQGRRRAQGHVVTARLTSGARSHISL
jgi:hypothetical protein